MPPAMGTTFRLLKGLICVKNPMGETDEEVRRAEKHKGPPPDLEALKEACTGKMDPEEPDRILKAYQEFQAKKP